MFRILLETQLSENSNIHPMQNIWIMIQFSTDLIEIEKV